MAATLGELLDLADAHLAEVTELLHRPDGAEQATHPATAVELSHLVGVLTRYTHKVGNGFGLRNREQTPIRRTARHCETNLRTVQDLINTPDEASTFTD